MNFECYSDLISAARQCESNIDKLKLLQSYFLKNVNFNYLMEIAINDYGIGAFEKAKQTHFYSEEEKEDVISASEKILGNKFKLPEEDRKILKSVLGKATPPTLKKMQAFGQISTITNPGYNGSLIDSIKRVSEPNKVVYENGLIKYGVCANFSEFAQNFCSDLDIKCYKAYSHGHCFNIVEIDGEKRVFDFTRMIAIRDDFHNFNGQEIEDWFNMPFEKMFKYRPDRIILKIDNNELQSPISKNNYHSYLSKKESEIIK